MGIQNAETSETEEQWTGDYVFENEWQSFGAPGEGLLAGTDQRRP